MWEERRFAWKENVKSGEAGEQRHVEPGLQNIIKLQSPISMLTLTAGTIFDKICNGKTMFYRSRRKT